MGEITTIDILMITHQRPDYTRLSLPRLLESCDDAMRVWVWHNGQDTETLEVIRSNLGHPNLFRFEHSSENQKLTTPTNWMWSQATGGLLGKVDDDVLVPLDWAVRLRAAHEREPRLGALSGWLFLEEDFSAGLARKKMKELASGIRIIRHPWIGGGTYLMKKDCVLAAGPLLPDQTFPEYCRELSWRGWLNGWLYPLVLADHMDDPRSPNTLLQTDEDMRRNAPLTAIRNGITTVKAWEDLNRGLARTLLEARSEPCRFFVFRKWIYRLRLMLSGLRKSTPT